jgi:hypothetical protein
MTECRINSTHIQTYMWSDNSVRELATVCLPWEQWTEILVWFDDVGISVFHSCVVFYLRQSLSEWHLLLSKCFWCAIARMSELLVKLCKSGTKIRELLVKVYGDNAMKKTAVYK